MVDTTAFASATAITAEALEQRIKFRLDLSSQQSAERVLGRYSRNTNDALIVIGRWIGLDGER